MTYGTQYLNGSLTISKRALFALLGHRGTPYLQLPDGTKGIVGGITRESGCGSCFNVNLNVGGTPKTVFVRTID